MELEEVVVVLKDIEERARRGETVHVPSDIEEVFPNAYRRYRAVEHAQCHQRNREVIHSIAVGGKTLLYGSGVALLLFLGGYGLTHLPKQATAAPVQTMVSPVQTIPVCSVLSNRYLDAKFNIPAE
jgi:hypothetical protein